MTVFLGVLFASLAAISWGINSHILHRGAQNEHPIMALVYRAIISLPILLLITLSFRGTDVLLVYLNPYNFFMTFLLISMIVLGDGIFINAMKKYPVSVILPVATTYPLFTTIILVLSGLESVTILIIIGTVGIVFGIYLVTKYRYDEENSRTGIELEAVLLGLGVAIGWGMSVIFARIILDQEVTESFGLMTVRTLMIGVFATTIYFGRSSSRDQFSDQSWNEKRSSMKIFGLSGIFGWVFGATFLFLALEEIAAAIATPISASNPVIAVIIGQVTGIDKINIRQLIGILITTIGVILIVI